MTQPSRKTFNDVIDKWADDVRATALKLFDDGIPVDHCVPIALKVVEAKDIGRARTLIELTGATPKFAAGRVS